MRAFTIATVLVGLVLFSGLGDAATVDGPAHYFAKLVTVGGSGFTGYNGVAVFQYAPGTGLLSYDINHAGDPATSVIEILETSTGTVLATLGTTNAYGQASTETAISVAAIDAILDNDATLHVRDDVYTTGLVEGPITYTAGQYYAVLEKDNAVPTSTVDGNGVGVFDFSTGPPPEWTFSVSYNYDGLTDSEGATIQNGAAGATEADYYGGTASLLLNNPVNTRNGVSEINTGPSPTGLAAGDVFYQVGYNYGNDTLLRGQMMPFAALNLLSTGSVCTPTGTPCSSTFCTDGYCCDIECLGDCGSCGLTGTEGTCVFNATTDICTDVDCQGTTLTPASTCDGVSAACPIIEPEECPTGQQCSSNNTLCIDSPVSSSDDDGENTGIIGGGAGGFFGEESPIPGISFLIFFVMVLGVLLLCCGLCIGISCCVRCYRERAEYGAWEKSRGKGDDYTPDDDFGNYEDTYK